MLLYRNSEQYNLYDLLAKIFTTLLSYLTRSPAKSYSFVMVTLLELVASLVLAAFVCVAGLADG